MLDIIWKLLAAVVLLMGVLGIGIREAEGQEKAYCTLLQIIVPGDNDGRYVLLSEDLIFSPEDRFVACAEMDDKRLITFQEGDRSTIIRYGDMERIRQCLGQW